MKQFALLFFSVTTILTSCIKSNTYEKNITIPSQKWKHSFKPSFEFDITDTNSNYLLFFTMRHTDAYPFSNIWLNVKTTMPNGSLSPAIRTEVPLAQADGKWLGRGSGDILIWDHKMPMTKDGAVHFDKKGTYKIELEQVMREDPLPEIMSVGIRLEKITK